jgi:hypothetical protein
MTALPSNAADNWFTPGRFLALLALALFAAFPEVVLGSHTFYYRDFGHFAYPLAHYHRECFWRGEVPLWNPYNSCGLPHLAQWNTMCLYPGTLIYLVGPMPWALGWFSLAHLLLAGAGAYRLAHHWTGNRFAASVGGLAFAFNGFTLHAVMWPNNIAALAWAPWLWLLVERACKEGGRTVLLAALVGAMQMLAGAPEVILFTWAIAAALLLVDGLKRKTESVSHVPLTHYVLRFTAIVALTSLLSAAQLLPFLDLVQHSHRSAAYDDDFFALPAWGWANVLVPLFHASPAKAGVYTVAAQQWTSSYYPGVTVLLLATLAVGRVRTARVAWLAGAAVLGMMLALGKNGHLLPLLKAIFPQLGFIRFPVKHVLPFVLVTPLLAALAMQHWARSAAPAEERRPLGWIAGLMLGFMGLIVSFAFAAPAKGELAETTLWNGVTRAAFLLASAGLLWNWPARRSPVAQLAIRAGLLLLLALDVFTHMPRQVPTVVTLAYEPGMGTTGTSPRLGEGRAMLSRETDFFFNHAGNPDALLYCMGVRRNRFANWNLLDEVPKVNGFFCLFPRELSDTWWLLYSLTNAPPTRLMDFLGVNWVTAPDNILEWIPRPNARPLVTAGAEPVFTDAASTLRELANPGFDARGTVFLPKELGATALASNATAITRATVLSTRWERESVSFEVEANAPAWVVIAQTYYHPWKAFEGERELPIRRANHAFQAIEISEGWHSLQLRYVDHAFRLGAFLSLGTLGCVVFGIVRLSRRPLNTEH